MSNQNNNYNQPPQQHPPQYPPQQQQYQQFQQYPPNQQYTNQINRYQLPNVREARSFSSSFYNGLWAGAIGTLLVSPLFGFQRQFGSFYAMQSTESQGNLLKNLEYIHKHARSRQIFNVPAFGLDVAFFNHFTIDDDIQTHPGFFKNFFKATGAVLSRILILEPTEQFFSKFSSGNHGSDYMKGIKDTYHHQASQSGLKKLYGESFKGLGAVAAIRGFHIGTYDYFMKKYYRHEEVGLFKKFLWSFGASFLGSIIMKPFFRYTYFGGHDYHGRGSGYEYHTTSYTYTMDGKTYTYTFENIPKNFKHFKRALGEGMPQRFYKAALNHARHISGVIALPIFYHFTEKSSSRQAMMH